MQRRDFITSAAAGAAVWSWLETSRGYAANDTIQVGCIGTGGRCRRLMESLRTIPNVKITAVCDVWDVHLNEGRKLAAEGAFATREYQELLARPDVDAVVIGTPDHWHVPITIAACAAGKDVYVEKPLTHDLSEGPAVIEAQDRHRRIVQVGTQQRSMPHIAEAREIIRSGGIGRVLKLHLTWNRNSPRATVNKLGIDPAGVDWKRFLGTAPDQPYDEYRFRNWRWFWDFGGGIFTDLMVHWIDVAHWILDLPHPLAAVSVGDFNMAQGVWQTPDTVQTLVRYASADTPPSESTGIQAYFEGTFSNARNGAMIEFMGTDATLYLDRGRFEIHPERKSKVAPREKLIGEGPRGADFYGQPDGELLHLSNWIECIRSRNKPTAPAEAGVLSAASAHLANVALRNGGTAVWKA